MKILLSILFNALILYLLAFFLWENTSLWVESGIIVEWGYITYIIWWAILWIINVTIRPILKILSLPFFFIFLWLVVLFINAIILWLLDYIFNQILVIPGISYDINWAVNFVIAVAIFTILNMFYTLLFNKK